MAFNVSDKTMAMRLNRELSDAKADEADSLSRLASGQVFTPDDPRPAERAIAEKMEYRLRSLSASKRNINDVISLLQTAESSMTEINHIVTRMKEINIAAASTTVSGQERRYLFIEYDALHREIDRISQTTEFNGIPLLHGASERAPEELIFRIDDPFLAEVGTTRDGEDLNTLRLDGFKSLNTTPEALGLRSASELLEEATNREDGVSMEAVEAMLLPEDEEGAFATVYDQAVANLSTQRAVYGGLQERLNRSLDFIDVYQENIAAAKSKIADTDYAEEVAKLMQAKIAVSATTSLLAQSNAQSSHTLQLLNNVL